MRDERKSKSKLTPWILVLLLTAHQVQAQTPPTKEERQARLQKAEALFKERCETSGEFIKRTVENVEGVYLLKLRPGRINYGSQFEMDDPYGRDLSGVGYIQSFVHGFWDGSRPKLPTPNTPPRVSYRYVEAIDPQDGKRYRYTGRIEEPWQFDKTYLKGYTRFVLDKVPAPGAEPRYGVTYDDISTREDRELWIAGSSLKVIDLKTNEVMAERIGYMMDRGQGNNSGGRSPWLLAANNACPVFAPTHGATAQRGQTEIFVEKVLHPKSD